MRFSATALFLLLTAFISAQSAGDIYVLAGACSDPANCLQGVGDGIAAPSFVSTGTPLGNSDLRGPPSISPASIQAILARAGSPAAYEPGFAQCLYEAGAASGIDPAFTLGFFRAESSFGRAGIARTTKGIGNVKGVGPAGSYNGFRKYNSWCESARDWFRLISTSRYYFRAGRYTVQQILPVYAPSSDNNNPAAYGNSVASWVAQWRSMERSA